MSANPEQVKVANWGRAGERVSSLNVASCLALFLLSPILVFYFYVTAFHFQGDLLAPLQALYRGELSFGALPPFKIEALGLFLGWLAFQVVLARLPDKLHKLIPFYKGGACLGAVTPAGNRLTYQINGLQAWVISHLFFVLGAFVFGWFSPTLIFDHWGSLLWIVNVGGFTLAAFAYVKALYFPSFSQDRKFSGSAIFDFFMGIELNPRLGWIDFKLFFNGRPGIIGWTLINLSFASAQWALYGQVTNSMWLVNLFHALYVLYFFWKESWYLKTIDIHHDHFGWMLAWGDLVWLPYMYTLQGLYLVFNPVELSLPYALFVLIFGLFGFALFAQANNQKDRFRETNGEALIWGEPPQSLDCSYLTQDGATRKTRLLLSGWWGISRHMNYTGDLILSLAYSLACGTTHLFPYFYFLFLTILLVHRCLRDEERCAAKYGPAWNDYTAQVQWRLIPYVW